MSFKALIFQVGGGISGQRPQPGFAVPLPGFGGGDELPCVRSLCLIGSAAAHGGAISLRYMRRVDHT